MHVMRFVITEQSSGVMRALRRDADGEIDESLVPRPIRDWYVDSEDEQDTTSECDSDCEWE